MTQEDATLINYAADRSYGIVKSSALPTILKQLDSSATDMMVTCCANATTDKTGTCGPGTGVACSQFCPKPDEDNAISASAVFMTSEIKGQIDNGCGLLPWFSGRYGLYDINYCKRIINKPVEIKRKMQTCDGLGAGWEKHPLRKVCYKSDQIK